MLCERNDDVTYFALIIARIAACEKVSCHKLAVASMQCVLRERNSLSFQERKLESVGDWWNGKGIQAAYFQYDSDFLKCKWSLFAWYRASSMLLVSNSLERYIDANSCLWRHSFVTFVHFKLNFFQYKDNTGNRKINKYWQINIWLSQLVFYNSYVNWCDLAFNRCHSSGAKLGAIENCYDWLVNTALSISD